MSTESEHPDDECIEVVCDECREVVLIEKYRFFNRLKESMLPFICEECIHKPEYEEWDL